jgi:DNA-binding NarL/FixJ family response regulator
VKTATGKRNKEIAESILEQSTIRTTREKIMERNRQLHNEYTRWGGNEVFI